MMVGNAFAANVSKSNFEGNRNVVPSDVISYLAENQVLFFRNDSAFVANINDDGELQNITYNKDLKRLQADGQVSIDPINKMAYYTQSGKLVVASAKEPNKWSDPKPIVVKGAEVKRDKYRGSVLAYANWRYMPKDSIVVLNPTISKDGTRLYFASNMQGSQGLDIWYMDKNENNEWSEPVRLDNRVNSEADEDFPFVRDNGSLTFASNRQTSLSTPEKGKYDLYYYNPQSGKNALLLASMLDDELKEPELLAENNIKEPEITDGPDLADNNSPKNNNGLNNSQNNDKNNYNQKNNYSQNNNGKNSNGLKDGYAQNSNGNINNNNGQKNNDRVATVEANDGPMVAGDVSNQKILEALEDNKRIKSTDDKISSEELTQTFNSNPDAVVKASSNVVATVDKRIFYFDYDKDVLNGSFKKDIEVILDFLKAYPNNDFLIIGHTDERGSYEYNDALSLKRAKKIESILVSRGISKSRLHVMAMGEYQPVIRDAKNENEHQKNRRVEIQRME